MATHSTRPTHHIVAKLHALCGIIGLGACSSGGSGGTATADLSTIEFSLSHIMQRRVHADMWSETVLTAYRNPFRKLEDIPPPSDPCIEVVDVSGDLEKGFLWTVRATRCEDLAGVTRIVSGDITFTGDEFVDSYTGTYAGKMTVQWFADPDGGRTAEAARLNADAGTLAISGTWEISTSLQGQISGTVQYAGGAVVHEDQIE